MEQHIVPREIITKAIKLYSNRFGASLMQFIMLLSYLGVVLMLIFTVKTVAFPDLTVGVNDDFIGFLAFIAIVFVISQVITAPYIYGAVWYSLNATEVKIVPSAAIFGCYNNPERVIKALKLEAYLTLRKLPVFLPIVVIVLTDVFLTVNIIAFTTGLMPIFAAGGCALSVFGLFMLYKVFALRFFPARHIFAENPDLPAKEIIAGSLALTKGKSNLLAGVYLRLLPWYIFSLLLLPALFVMPIATGVYSYLYKSLI
ncbi:MAG: DUF975 family protein [Ruminococcus sp.]|jgi:uncharacterized membrane protein|nr:DUF975 family protein [Ruminococcus sp.]